MSYFAQVQNGVVTQVIVADQDFINTGAVGDSSTWIETDPNTHGGVHYGTDGQPDGGVALRGNYAGVGSVYNTEHDMFHAVQLYPSWQLNPTTWTWIAPVAYPEDGNYYTWSESTQTWDLVPV